MNILFVGGTFDEAGGRPSGYIGKLGTALCEQLPCAAMKFLNGGTYRELQAAVCCTENVSHVLWFADVPNELPKLLPVLKARSPGLVLVASKNNRRGLYDRKALYARMQKSRSELLVEFGEGANGKLVASVLAVHGDVVLEKSNCIPEVAAVLAKQFFRLQELRFPLHKVPFSTKESHSFEQRALLTETEIPLGKHPGAFGYIRKNHVHEGVDLYGLPGDEVLAIENGIVIACLPFTGNAAGSPWWADTECVLIEGASGVINYGEVRVAPGLKPDVQVQAGQRIGELVTVLLKDKGRPMTMLHIERYARGAKAPLTEWALDTEEPAGLCDPTALLMQAGKRIKS